jgi:hypothetical protein
MSITEALAQHSSGHEGQPHTTSRRRLIVDRQPAHSRYTHVPREAEQTAGGASMGVKVRQ